MTSFVRYYDFVFNDLADNRVKGWTLMENPGPTLGIIFIYLISVYKILPTFMENRKPYNLKNVIYYYNLFQIFANIILVYGIATSGWTTRYSFGCQPVDYSNDPLSIRMLSFVYYTFLLKVIDLVETIFFVLRKKQNQVSKLHVYHHSSTALLGWVGVKYVGGGMATFPILINSFIHVLMYTYYWFSSLGPKWQKRLYPWKPKLTMAQMIQFCILVGHSLQSLAPSCHVPKSLLLIYLPNVLLIFYMFYEFYKNNYFSKSTNKDRLLGNAFQKNKKH